MPKGGDSDEGGTEVDAVPTRTHRGLANISQVMR